MANMKIIASISLFIVVALASLASAQHRGRNWDGYPNLGGSFDLRQTALNAGYNEGVKEGQKDRKDNKTRDFRDIKSYRDATKDYSSKLGDRDIYERYFRMAFETGYNDENFTSNNRNRDRDRDRNRDDNYDRGDHRGRNWDRYGT